MKSKTYYAIAAIFSAALLFSSSTLKAELDPPSQSESEFSATTSSDMHFGGFYFLIGANFAGGDYGKSAPVPVSESGIGSSEPYTADFGTGFRFELGYVFSIAEISDEFSFAARVGFLGGAVHSYKDNIPGSDQTLSRLNATVNVAKIAPQFTYSPAEDVAIDLYFGVAPTAVVGYNARINNHQGDAYMNEDVDISDFNHTGFGVSWQPGLAFRFKALMVGGELNFTTLDMDYKMPGADFNGVETKYPSARIFIGFKLNSD